MVHVAEPSFYAAVAQRLRTCSAVILEGLPGRRASYLTLTYRLLGQLGRLGLVTQSWDRLLSGYPRQIIGGDITQREFESSWSQLPLRVRAWMFLLVRVALVLLLAGRSREALVPRGLEDLPGREDILDGDADTDALDRVLLGERDAHLLTLIQAYFQKHGASAGRVGILYGAAHMPSVVQFLVGRLGFRLASTEWLPVMAFDS